MSSLNDAVRSGAGGDWVWGARGRARLPALAVCGQSKVSGFLKV